ncbi:MAG: TonB-dependent receptor [Flavobacteriaceae bacterium]|nr:TonB-dependent receptor [Flavobacteriaceae bacterium]
MTSIYWIQAQLYGSISGKIIKKSTAIELESVHIVVQNYNLSEFSKSDGSFQISRIPLNDVLIQISLIGFETLKIPVSLDSLNPDINLGIIRLTEKIEQEIDQSFINLNDEDLLVNDKGESNSISGLLVATKDVFLKTVAYEFSPTFFRPRNLGSEYSKVLLNGVSLNKLYNNRPQWSNWGGLNDVLRNQEFTLNTTASAKIFGDLAGVTNIITNAASYAKGIKISYASSNRSYRGRLMASFSSGLLNNGWAYTFSVSRRYANSGFREGTLYDANSFFIAIEKIINKKQSLNFTAIYAKNIRGKSSPNTQEVYDLKDIKYNGYWGFQESVLRNSRTRKIVEPILQLNHFWNIDTNTSLQTNITYQFGKSGNSRLDYGGAQIIENNNGEQNIIGGGTNPDPTYYQKLPSYFLRDPNNPDYANAYLAEKEFLKNGQVKWTDLYEANQNIGNNGNSIYALYEDRNDDKQFTFNTILNKKMSDKFIINANVEYKQLRSENFAWMLDLLGGKGYLDVDSYENNIQEAQNDLNNPNRIVLENERFKYNFNFDTKVYSGFAQTLYSTRKLDAYLAFNFVGTTYQRTGLFENGAFPENASFGKSKELNFLSFGVKTGATYKLTGRHIFTANTSFLSNAPTLQNSFSNARENNDIVIGLTNEKSVAIDVSYVLRHPKINAKITAYMIDIKDQTDISFYFADGLNLNNTSETTAFVQEVLTGINQQNTGIEIGIEVPVLMNIKLKGVAAIGQSVYTNNPNLYLTSDDFTEPLNYGEVLLKNYFVAGGPQQAYSVGFEYSSPKYWWFGATGNYFNNAFIDIAPITRTKNFYLDADGLPIDDYDINIAKRLLRQEKFEAYFLVNLVGGKSWKINNNYIGFFANVSNVLNTSYKTGGFEQSRNANYYTLLEDQLRDKPLFGAKYWFGYGTSYFASVYYRF